MSEEQKQIPHQEKGGKSDTTHHVALSNTNEAKALFNTAKQRLLDVSNWDKVCGVLSATFQLIDKDGQKVNRPAEEGDYFQINIPAPGTETGDGYDWVQIEEILNEKVPEKNSETVSIRVRPASNPLNADPDTAHFFKDDATSTFMVLRNGTTVKAEVHGRNEIPNVETEGLLDTVRNAVVGLGAILGFAKPQWKGLVKGLLEEDE